MERLVLFNHPGNSNVEVAAGFSMKLGFSPNRDSISVIINPNILDYQENADQPGISVRQFMVTSNTQETKNLEFNLLNKQIQIVNIDGKKFELSLEEKGEKALAEFGGQKFPYAQFIVTEL